MRRQQGKEAMREVRSKAGAGCLRFTMWRCNILLDKGGEAIMICETGENEMSGSDTKGKPGRPRIHKPANDDVRMRTTLNATKADRRRIERLRKMYGLTTAGAAVRWAVRSQLQVLQVSKGPQTGEADNIRGQRTLNPFTLWLNEKERRQVNRVRRGYRLDSNADAIRYSVREEAERVGV